MKSSETIALTPEAIEQLARRLAIEADKVLDVRAMCERLPFSRKVVIRMIRERRIPAIYYAEKWSISRVQFVKAKEAGFPLPTGRARRAA